MEEFYLINPLSDDLDTSSWPEIDLFRYWDHQITYPQLSTLLEKSWNNAPYTTLKLLFHLRNCHGGKGDRQQFYQGVRWFMENHPEQIIANVKVIPHIGYWKDLLNLWEFSNESLRAAITFTFCNQLEKDLRSLCNNEQPSLAAKWAPTEKCAHDRKWGFVDIFCEQLGWSRKTYRKNISKLRDSLCVTERLACDQRWGEMDFPEIPTKSRLIFHRSLQKYCGRRYERWCKQPRQYHTHAYDVMALLRDNTQPTIADSKWREINKNFGENYFGDSLCVCDTSPSMSSYSNYSPINIAMALTLLISNHSSDKFKNKVITCSEQPELFNISGDTPTEKVHSLQCMPWGYSFDFKAVIELLIEKKRVPEQLFIFTDSKYDHRKYKEIIEMFKERDLTPPENIYFWNLCGWGSYDFNLDYHDQGIIVINGFIHELFTAVTQAGKLYPWLVLKKLLESDVYSKICLV